MSEILAPSGGFESVVSALRCGADAVYIGGKNFSARQNAKNFTDDEIKTASDLCHLYGAKLYIALNTIVFDSQLDELAETAIKYAKLGADAFIIQDIGVASIIKKAIPNINIHASTQMTVHNAEGALFLKQYGFSRVVVSRELPKETIAEICKCGIETEVFVHGSLCMSVSGQCYMSAVIGSRSANRGLCAQPCRLPFTANADKNASILSLKDLSLIEYLKEMEEIGVSSFKIEGRMKRPEYVASAVTACKKALNGEKYDIEGLRAVFSRSGFTSGYYTAKHNNMFGTRQKDDVISANEVLPIYRLLYAKERKVTDINFDIKIAENIPVDIKAYDSENNSVQIYGDIPQKALNRPIDLQQLEKQFSKLGDNVYSLGKINAEIGDGLMLPASSLNALRRECTEMLDKARIIKNTPVYQLGSYISRQKQTYNKIFKPSVFIRIKKGNQIFKVSEYVDKIIIPLEIISEISETDFKWKFIIEPPRFITCEKEISEKLKKAYEMGYRDLMCNNISYIKTGRDIGFNLHGDFGLNTANSESIEIFSEFGLKTVIVSFEMKLKQLSEIERKIPCGIIAYGRLPLMLVRNCPINAQNSTCKDCSHTIQDRTEREIYVFCNKEKSYAELLNADILYLADKPDDLMLADFIVLNFYDETPEQIKKIIDAYLTPKIKTQIPAGITRGLYYRGVI